MATKVTVVEIVHSLFMERQDKSQTTVSFPSNQSSGVTSGTNPVDRDEVCTVTESYCWITLHSSEERRSCCRLICGNVDIFLFRVQSFQNQIQALSRSTNTVIYVFKGIVSASVNLNV